LEAAIARFSDNQAKMQRNDIFGQPNDRRFALKWLFRVPA
jgi:hypothetical protein